MKQFKLHKINPRMKYKLYAFGWCYWICGNTNYHITSLTEHAEEFAKEIGVPLDKVVFDGRITDSTWCRNHQLYGAPVETKPDNYTTIKVSIWNYINID
jgi:hypothetical protein